ncbi:hypothetical protein QQZ08_005916 [Neonectria magnoliae]|uniref:Protein kinase domain-containing protein n=1 Tax=Neonectria magnoliae TaxID=2732573 RepID=A0ABR1I2Q3_9HYPO
MTISRDEDGSLTSTISTDPLPEIQTVWHEARVNVLSLKKKECLRSGVHGVEYNGEPAIAKIACFKWDIARIEHKTWVYSILARHQSQHPNESPIAPEFLGHLTENRRVMEFLLRRFKGEPACVKGLASCEILVRRLHLLGLIHGDLNRYNFVVDRNSGTGMRLIDFEHVEQFN